jgi:iron only hydrogenase large subunit-like protein
MGMFEAKEVNFDDIPEEEYKQLDKGTGNGRIFAVSGGVAKAVADVIKELDPEREIKVAHAEGLRECRKLLTLAKAGKYNGYLLEGMACPGGCVAGAGTLQSVSKSSKLIEKYALDADKQNSLETEYSIDLEFIKPGDKNQI